MKFWLNLIMFRSIFFPTLSKLLLFSSPVHKVHKVSFCDQSVSVVRPSVCASVRPSVKLLFKKTSPLYRVPTQPGKREKVGNFVKSIPGRENVVIFTISDQNREKIGKSTKRFGGETSRSYHSV